MTMPDDDVQDDDLAVLGQDDSDLDMSDTEGTSGVLDGKTKSAFVKLRQERQALRKELEATKKTVEQLSAGVIAAQRQQQSRTTDDPSGLRRRYRESVRQRALQNLTGEVFTNQDEQNMAVWQEMQAIAANDAAELAVQRVVSIQAPQVVENVLSGFSQLDEEDKAAVRKVVDSLPPNLRVDPQVIRKEIHSYIGQNFEKFAKPPEQQNDKGKRTGTPATGQKTSDGRIRLSESAAAAAASGLKGGSLGVRLTETSQQGGSRKRAEPLTDEDISTMRNQGANPNDPEDVKLFQEAKDKAKRVSSGLA
jgi:hypothetical protein